MLEILIATVFLAACAGAIVEGVYVSNLNGAAALRRNAVLDALESQLETARGAGNAGTVTVGTTTSTQTITGLESAVTITTSISLHSGFTSLYDVTASATWNEPTFRGTRSDNLSVSTMVRQ